MLRLALPASILLLVLGCGDSSEKPLDVTIDTYNVGFAGSFVPYETERRQAVLDIIANMPSDIACLQEVWEQSDKEVIATAAGARFPHRASFMNDLSTPVDDPTGADGTTPPAPTTAPCAEATLTEKLDAALACLKASCSTIPGSDDGKTTSVSCAASSCAAHALPLLSGTTEEKRCYGCVASHLPASTFGEMRTACTTQTNGDLAFGGQSGVMVLSRYAFDGAVEAFVLPATWLRRIILRAPVKLPNGVTVDVYCNHLSPIFNDFLYPYTGVYGGGATDWVGWEREQTLQAHKLVAYVAEKSGDRPAIILGDMNASREHQENGTVVVAAEGVPTMEVLEAAFDLAVTPDFAPRCTHCPDNGVTVETTDPVFIDHIWLKNIPVTQVKSSVRTYDQATVTVTAPSGPLMVHPSDHYGLRSVITIAP
jgi:endonuclease/exonuclease/phosphatase family metal-dependent hydrolase